MILVRSKQVYRSVINGRHIQDIQLCHKCTLLQDIRFSWKKYPFGGTPKIGCSSGLFTVKTLLNIQKNHKLTTFVDFFNLVKAFDTAGHEPLIKVLEIYGYPPKFCYAIL